MQPKSRISIWLQGGDTNRRCTIAFYSNTLAVVRQYLASIVGDNITGVCGTTGATTQKIYAPFLYQPDDYYNQGFYEVYVYAGTNIGVTKRVTDWVLSTYLLTVHSVYSVACNATSYIELHRIFTVDELNKAINLAIDSIGKNYLVDIKDETTVLVADTYEYELPLSMLFLHKVTTEDEAAGGKFYEDDIIDPREWSILPSYPPKLKLDKRYYSITAGKDLRLEGQGAQPTVDDDADTIFIPPDWLVQKAITFLPQNKIQSNALDKTYQQALLLSAREPRASASPFARAIVE